MDRSEQAKKVWAAFAPTEVYTAQAAPRLVAYAGVEPGKSVLDVACGTGVVAIAAARVGAQVTGLDLTPELVARAKENAAIAGVDVTWREGDVEALPFDDGSFDVVVSQFGHMFAPRAEVAAREMLRVLRPGGTIAIATWPPELFVGKLFALVGRHAPPPPPGGSPPQLWGVPEIVRERLGDGVRDVAFDRGTMRMFNVSARHVRGFLEASIGPIQGVVRALSGDAAKLDAFRAELDALVAAFYDASDNALRQDYLLTRATKAG